MEISIEDVCMQDDLVEFAGWKLYNCGKFPNKGKMDDWIVKRERDGKMVVKPLGNILELEEESKCFGCVVREDVRRISKDEVAFQLGEGVYKVPVDGGEVEMEYKYSEKIYNIQHSLIPHKWLYLRGKDEDIRQFISEADHYGKMMDKKYVRVFGPSQKGFWENLCKNPRRDVNTVFIGRKKEILEDLEKFLGSEGDYHIFGHPYKRNYLFYGPPGNGKTSFINAIAGKYNFNIYLMSFSNVITDEIFKKLISGLPRNALLVMEDIDVLFGEKKVITMSTVLNTLDGLARKNRVICVMTTNNFGVLSDVFKRPGRLDMLVEFGKADERCFEEMAEFMVEYKGEGDKELVKKRARDFYGSVSFMEPSRALVQKYLFENREKKMEEIFSERMVKKFREINDLYENSEKNVINMYS